jgi:hypothetical protein
MVWNKIFFALLSLTSTGVKVHGQNYFGYTDEDGEVNGDVQYGQPNWGEVECDDVDTCVSELCML